MMDLYSISGWDYRLDPPEEREAPEGDPVEATCPYYTFECPTEECWEPHCPVEAAMQAATAKRLQEAGL